MDLADNITHVQGALTDKLCDAFLDEFRYSNEWAEGVVNGDYVNKDKLSCSKITLTSNETIYKNYKQRYKLYWYLESCINEVMTAYCSRFEHITVNSGLDCQVRRHRVGDFHAIHLEADHDFYCAISCVFGLNDDYEGGEIVFPTLGKKFKVNKGSALIFPSNFLYPCETQQVTSGTSYSILKWFL